MELTNHELIVLLATTLGGGLGVTLVAGFLKRVFGIKAGAVVHTVVIGLSALGAGAQYVLGLHGVPPMVLGVSASSIYGVSQWLYKFSKVAGVFLGNVKATYQAGKSASSAAPVASSVPTAQTAVETAPAPVSF